MTFSLGDCSPGEGSEVEWRYNHHPGDTFRYGFVTSFHPRSTRLIMGRYKGDVDSGPIVRYTEIEWRPL